MKRKFQDEMYNYGPPKLCCFLIWVMVFYSLVIQQKYFEIPKGMLLLGFLICLSFVSKLSINDTINSLLIKRECAWQLIFYLYMLTVGTLVSPSVSTHLSQWTTSFEYFVIMILMSYIIQEFSTESFHWLFLVIAVVIVIILLGDPVALGDSGRYSISSTMNPNSIGMIFSAGIWCVLYFQQRYKINVLIALGLTVLLIYGILLTGSRKSLISAVLVIVLWLIFSYLPSLKYDNISVQLIKIVFIVVISIFIVALFIYLYQQSGIAKRMDNLDDEVTSGARRRLYDYGFQLFKQSPIFGYGFQGFKYYYLKYYSHATLVEIPVSAGIVGTIIYFSFYISSIKKCFKLFWLTCNNYRLQSENLEIRMIINLWISMLFFCICIIHPYEIQSFLIFSIIIGQSRSIERRVNEYYLKERHE